MIRANKGIQRELNFVNLLEIYLKTGTSRSWLTFNITIRIQNKSKRNNSFSIIRS